MTFRSKSRRRQWRRWLYAALVALVLQALATFLVLGSVSFDLLDPDCYRLALPIVLVFGLFAWETRWDGVTRRRGGERGRSTDDGREHTPGAPQSVDSVVSLRNDCGAAGVRALPQPNNKGETPSSTSDLDLSPADETGEALFERARSLPHQPIPDFEIDADYLALLGQSAAKGYAPALAKLGEYAMRRAAWVEAYYWMTLARRNGMHGLSPTLREICTCWARDGFPHEEENVNEFFTAEAGSIGRALLGIDSGYDAVNAKEFLWAHYPEFLR